MDATLLLDQAIKAMEKLHESLVPNDNEEQDAMVPAFAVREFVDAHAALLYERKRLAVDTSAAQSVRFNPIQHIKQDTDFVMSMLVKMAQVTLSPEHIALAKVVALREAEKRDLTLLSVIEAFEAEPILRDFGAKLREAALPGVYDKYFDPVAAHSTQGLYPMRGVDWAIASRTAQIDKDVSAKAGAKSLLDRLTPKQQKELDTWSRSQTPVRGVVNMMAWPGWAEALQQNLISKA